MPPTPAHKCGERARGSVEPDRASQQVIAGGASTRGDGTRGAARTRPSEAVQRTLALFDVLVHPVTGLVQVVDRVTRDPDAVGLHVYSARAHTRLLRLTEGVPPEEAARAEPVGGTGVAWDPDTARVRAVGECVERYALAGTGHRRFEWATWPDAGASAVRPDALALVTDEERAAIPDLAPFREDTVFPWVDAVDLHAERPVRVPATCVHRHLPRPGGLNVTRLLPNGSACAGTPEAALAGALQEAVERDALMRFWLRREPLPRLPLHALPDPRAVAAVRDAEARGLRVHLFDMTSDTGFPAATCLLQDESGCGPALAQGTGARFDHAEAAVRAVEEAFHMRARGATLDVQAREPGGNGLPGGGFAWWPARRLPEAAWLLESGRIGAFRPFRDPGTASARVKHLVATLADVGASAFAVDVTPPDVASVGLHVAAVLTPGLLPKTPWTRHVHAGTPRLACAFDELNPLPVPFP